MTLRLTEVFEHHFVELGEEWLRDLREGKGTPLVLVQGCPDFWREWHRLIGPLETGVRARIPGRELERLEPILNAL